MPAFALRDARATDFETLYLLDQACFEPAIAYSRRQLRGFLTLPTAETIVAESRGEILGFVLGSQAGHRLGHVVTLDVASEHRRRGVGSALLDRLVRRFDAERVAEVRLEVDTANEPAIRFYEQAGFQKKRRVADYYGPGRPAWEMRLAMPPRRRASLSVLRKGNGPEPGRRRGHGPG